MLRVAGVTILYQPDENVYANILSYLPYLELLIIADNSPVKSLPPALQSHAKIIYLHNGENEGIAKRLNQAAEITMNKGFEWLLTMDQDSQFAPPHVEKYFTLVQTYTAKNNVAMFGVEYEKKQSENAEAIEINYLITSGSMVNLSLFTSIGGFDEKLFIDEVDLEYCFNAISKGYKIVKFPGIYLNHSLGVKGTYRSFKNFKNTQRSLHSSHRLYYMLRNFLYVQKKYKGQFVTEDKWRKKALLNRIKNNLLYGNKKLETLRLLGKAFYDFRKNNMGKIK